MFGYEKKHIVLANLVKLISATCQEIRKHELHKAKEPFVQCAQRISKDWWWLPKKRVD
jgi:hypothetical protein